MIARDLGRYPVSPQELASWASHYRRLPATPMLLRRLIQEIVQLRAMFYAANRDPQKSQPLTPHDLAPDFFDPPAESGSDEQAEIDRIGESLMQSFGGFTNG